MSVPFKYLPHEIFKKPKPAPTIRVYPAAPHEFFYPQANREASDATQASDRHPCPPLITEPTLTNPKKKKKPTSRPIGNIDLPPPISTHQVEIDSPAAETHRLRRRRRRYLHHQPPLLSASTTTDTKTQGIALPSTTRADAVFPVVLRHRSRRQVAPPSIAGPISPSFSFCVFFPLE